MEKAFYIAAMGWMITQIPFIQNLIPKFKIQLITELFSCSSCLSFWLSFLITRDPLLASFAFFLAAVYEGLLATLKIKLP